MKITKTARDQSCVRCGAEDGTTVWAHYTGMMRQRFGGGFGIKVNDAVGAHLCMRCHKYMDTESRGELPPLEHSHEFLVLCALTWIRLEKDFARRG